MTYMTAGRCFLNQTVAGLVLGELKPTCSLVGSRPYWDELRDFPRRLKRALT